MNENIALYVYTEYLCPLHFHNSNSYADSFLNILINCSCSLAFIMTKAYHRKGILPFPSTTHEGGESLSSFNQACLERL